MLTVAAFTIDSWKEKPWDRGPGGRLTHTKVNRSYQGALAGRSKGELLSAYGEAGPRVFSGLEVVRCVLDGRRGGFHLFHVGRVEGERTLLEVTIVDGSGVGELTGIAGRAELARSADGTHRIRLDYDLL